LLQNFTVKFKKVYRMPSLPIPHAFLETLIHRKELAKGRVVTMVSDEIKTARGETSQRDVVLHPGGVCVLPMTEAGQVILIQQFRYPTGELLWEFPAGKLDVAGEPPEAAIMRELWEETGYMAREWEAHGYIYTAPGFCNERIYLYIARGCTPAKTAPPQVEDEVIETHLFELEEVRAMARQGLIQDAKTLALLNFIDTH
jgi:ADP-ribose pyrophosphatase